MVRFEDECVGCPTEMGCLGGACKYTDVPHLICDICESETILYHFNDQHLCAECVLDQLDEVTMEEALTREGEIYDER